MDTQRKNQIVEAWIAMSLAAINSKEYEANFWSFEEIWRLGKDRPLEAWEVVLGLVDAATSEQLLSVVGAGPLEDLMCGHGETLIPLVEREAANNPKLRAAMGAVYLDGEDTPVWQKFYEIAGIQPPVSEDD